MGQLEAIGSTAWGKLVEAQRKQMRSVGSYARRPVSKNYIIEL
jgi:hypothetical protein